MPIFIVFLLTSLHLLNESGIGWVPAGDVRPSIVLEEEGSEPAVRDHRKESSPSELEWISILRPIFSMGEELVPELIVRFQPSSATLTEEARMQVDQLGQALKYSDFDDSTFALRWYSAGPGKLAKQRVEAVRHRLLTVSGRDTASLRVLALQAPPAGARQMQSSEVIVIEVAHES